MVEALEAQNAKLKDLIRRLTAAGNKERDRLLAQYALDSNEIGGSESPTRLIENPGGNGKQDNHFTRSREGQLRRLRDTNVTQFFGGTSLFQLHLSVPPASSPGCDGDSSETALHPGLSSAWEDEFMYGPRDALCLTLLATFFRQQYQHNMCVYREFFLRDYDLGSGPYYSDALLFAICSMGALASDFEERVAISLAFATQAQAQLYQQIERPDLTTLQCLLILGYCNIGHGNTSKGWLFCGMAFRLAHEMGLHLDPENWQSSEPTDRAHQILRRTYWASFVADKQLSLYFGRPPALYPHQSDVRDTSRMEYPPDWQILLNSYIADGVSPTTYEDGPTLVQCFVKQAELAMILHDMIADVFENRRAAIDPAILSVKVLNTHLLLLKWSSSLPAELHWTQHSSGVINPGVLHLQ